MTTKIEIYEFLVPPDNFYRYTSSQESVTYDGDTYTAIAGLVRGDRVQTVDPQDNQDLSIEMPIDDPFVQLFESAPPKQKISVKISKGFRTHGSAVLTGVEQTLVGEVIAVESENYTARVTVALSIANLAEKGPKGLYSAVCRHQLYGRGCKLDIGDFIETATVQALDPSTRVITVDPGSGFAAQYFRGGIFRVDSDSDALLITDDTPTTGTERELTLLTLSVQLLPLDINDEVELAPGCNFSPGTCKNKFNNFENFGGFPTLSSVERSPFFDGWRR